MQSVLKVEQLTFGYDKQKLLFEALNLTLHKGELKAIVGASGAGKSTLFELILGNQKPLAGTITVTPKIAQVFQDPYSSFHPSYKIIEQIADVADLSGIDAYAAAINLKKELLTKLPHQLSGGELERASIVRALLMRPELLLLDEPTSALDNIIEIDVMRLLLKELDKIGILLITHDLDLARWCADEIMQI